MNLDINPRGNGACPLCAANGACRIQRRLRESIDECPGCSDPDSGDLEIVIYSCPGFKERA